MSIPVFSFIRDFSNDAATRFFLTDSDGFREVDAATVSAISNHVVCHDYWMICRTIYNLTGKLPKKVIDIDEFSILASRNPSARKKREKVDVADRISTFLEGEQNILTSYKRSFYQETDVDLTVIEKFHELLQIYYIEVCRRANAHREFERFFEIEVPCLHLCSLISSRGIPIDSGRISTHRKLARHGYYEHLKQLSDRFDVPLEVPADRDVLSFAAKRGVDVDEYSLDFIVNYLPQLKEYSDLVLQVRELAATRDVLDSIALTNGKTYPTVDTQGSRTSRISVRSPFLQSLAKRYRDIIVPTTGKTLSYVDFDQFEVGIMAALSGDRELHILFRQEDMYETFRQTHLGGQGTRKAAKILFLAYAYGMKRRNLPIVGASFGIDHDVIKAAFKKFSTFEIWKQTRLNLFGKQGYVETSLGNRFYRAGKEATKKERLSAISQIVQGEGSLIFKKALIKIANMPDVEITLPMHDALLFQHSAAKTPTEVVAVFSETMTEHFEGQIDGKASIENFFAED